jgi:hypothetical protein
MAKKKAVSAVPEDAVAQPQPDESRVVRANINREPYEADDFAMLYANDTQVQMSPWDFRMIFGVIKDAPTAERPTYLIKTVGEVRMSPPHAKRVAIILMQQLKRYEEIFGPIPQPD